MAAVEASLPQVLESSVGNACINSSVSQEKAKCMNMKKKSTEIPAKEKCNIHTQHAHMPHTIYMHTHYHTHLVHTPYMHTYHAQHMHPSSKHIHMSHMHVLYTIHFIYTWMPYTTRIPDVSIPYVTTHGGTSSRLLSPMNSEFQES